MSANSQVKLIRPEDTWPLRHAVLRTGRPIETCRWDGDELPTTFHFGLYIADELVAIASIYERGCSQAPDPDSWQLRGMAVDSKRQKQGLGGAILVDVIEHCRNKLGGHVMWCNARSGVVDFYRHHGFQAVSDEFMIENVGPHYVMVRDVM